MPRIARIIAPHYPHHITQRGNNRADAFFDDDDKTTYLLLLKDHCEKWTIEIWVYCLMTNHLGKKRGQIYFTNSSKLRIIGDSRYVRPRQGRVIQRVCIPPRKQGHPPAGKSLEAV